MDAYDVVIIGTGAGGGTLARRLAPSGKKILLLERGDWLPREAQNWLAKDVFVDNRYVSPDTWYDAQGKPFQPQIHYFVGGATKLYGAALYRLRKEDFGELQHHDGISPAWPISYDELEPYYTQAEELYRVHGARGEDPTEPHASAPYPFPALSHEPRIQQLADDLAAAGYHPFHAPSGVMIDEANMPYSACARCPNCDGFPCLLHAKSDAEVLGVRPALAHSNVTLLTNAKAVKLETNAAGSAVTGVTIEAGRRNGAHRCGARRARLRSGEHREAPLALGERPASERPCERLRSGRPQLHVPQQPGRARALARGEPDGLPEDARAERLLLRSKSHEYPLGNIQMVGKSQAEMFRGEKPGETKLAPEWSLDRVAKHAIDFWLSTEDLPLPENRVTVDRDGKLTLRYTATNEVPKQKLYEQLKSMLGSLDMNEGHLIKRFAYMKNEIPVAGVAHQVGTCRMGNAPETSVVRQRVSCARARQPVRRRHERLPEHRGGEPGAHGNGQLVARRRSPARAPGRLTSALPRETLPR